MTDAMEEAHGGEADANPLDETCPPFAKPRGGRPILCGTYGCTLPNNHRGLHALPAGDQGRSSRKRAKTEKLDEVFEETDPPATQDPDARYDDLSDEDPPAAPPRLPTKPPAQTSAPEPRPIEAVAGLCKKTPYCQRYKNHPGARPRTQPPHAPAKPPRAEGKQTFVPRALPSKYGRYAHACSSCVCEQACARPPRLATRLCVAPSHFGTPERAASRPHATRIPAAVAPPATRVSAASSRLTLSSSTRAWWLPAGSR